ncbi:MAG: ATP-binding protein [Myxococcota bacterium]
MPKQPTRTSVSSGKATNLQQVPMSDSRRSRQEGVGGPNRELEGYDAVRSAQLGAVGTSFLRVRPYVVAVGIMVVLPSLIMSPAPPAQWLTLGCGLAVMLTFFAVESWQARRRMVDRRQLFVSLLITIAGISVGCLATGAIRSPLLPLLFAPIVTMFAAFGREGWAALVGGGTALTVLAVCPPGLPWPPIVEPWFSWIAWTATALSLTLLWLSVTGLTQAYRSSGEALERMRAEVLKDSRSRLQSLEAMGAKVAHELKNPLTSTKALVQLMARNVDPTSRDARRLDVLTEEIARMGRILEDYLSFARPLEALNLALVDLNELVAEVAEVLEAWAEARGVEVEVEVPGQAEITLTADRAKLKQVLLNLALNGVDACPAVQGRLRLVVESTADGGALLTVEDNGMGMAPEMLERLGTPFFTTREQGTGLGVVVARSVVVQHGGTLTYRSSQGEGTAATVRLPKVPGLGQVDGGDDGDSRGG